MKLVIKNPAPNGPVQQFWGDYHFGLALERELVAAGVEVEQQFWPCWDKPTDADVVLVLRGPRRWLPKRGPMSLIWLLSHPSQVSIDELNRFDVVFVGADTHRRLLLERRGPPIRLLRQASPIKPVPLVDPDEPFLRSGVQFVGNARGGLFRDIVSWALDAGIEPEIIGREWENTAAARYTVNEYINNSSLQVHYRKGQVGLNDHWSDMKYFGYINNRVFDCLFSGLPLLSDHFPELQQVFGGGLHYVHNSSSLSREYQRLVDAYPDVLAQTREMALALYPDYSFARRAQEIIEFASHPLRQTVVRSVFLGASRTVQSSRKRLLGAARASSILQSAAERLAKRKRTHRRFIHIHPSEGGNAAFSQFPSVEHMTGGMGVGPWDVSLDQGLGQIRHRRFDAVIVEHAAPSPDRQAVTRSMVSTLGSLLQRNGLLVLPRSLADAAARSRTLRFVQRDNDLVLLQAESERPPPKTSGESRAGRRDIGVSQG